MSARARVGAQRNGERLACEAPDDAADSVGCRRGFNHGADDFIRSCAEGISQVHASITPESDGRFLVQNLSRTNPTRVDLENVPAQGTRALAGQRVALGQWDFVLGPQWPPRAFRRGTWRLPLRGLTVQAHGRVLLDNVSLVAERSELVALMGPSGAGKTTLLYALARIKAPRDLPVQEDPARFWGSLGYVPQDDICCPARSPATWTCSPDTVRRSMRRSPISRGRWALSR